MSLKAEAKLPMCTHPDQAAFCSCQSTSEDIPEDGLKQVACECELHSQPDTRSCWEYDDPSIKESGTARPVHLYVYLPVFRGSFEMIRYPDGLYNCRKVAPSR